MKILFHIINFNLGGTEKSLLNLINSIPKSAAITILCLEKKGELLKEVPSSVNVVEINNNDIINEYIKIGPRNFALKQLRRGNLVSFLMNIWYFLLKKVGFNVPVFNGLRSVLTQIDGDYDYAVAYAGPHDFISYYILNYVHAKRKYQWIHFDISKVLKDYRFGNRYYSMYDKIVCVSDNIKDLFIKTFPYTSEKVITVSNIVPKEEIIKKSQEEKGFRENVGTLKILTVGRLSTEKGQDMIPTVVKRLIARNYQFKWYLIGDGALKSEITKTIKEYNLEDYLICLGKLINPYPFLKGCDIYVQTSLHEGDPVVLKEAKVFNRPIVTTNFLSASNLIKDGVDGLIVDISVEGIYAGVKRMLEDENFRLSASKTVLIQDNNQDIKKLFSNF